MPSYASRCNFGVVSTALVPSFSARIGPKPRDGSPCSSTNWVSMSSPGSVHCAMHRSLPEIHQHLLSRGVTVAPRTVTNLLERYDELLTLSLTDTARLQRITQAQGRVILALDGLQPEGGHEVLGVLRDCLSGEVLWTRSLLSAPQEDLAGLLRTVRQSLPVPVRGIIADGQLSIRCAVAAVFPDVPHPLCHFHSLREAAKPIDEADRHAKKELKKHVSGVRPIQRRLAGRSDREAEVVRGYCSAVRSALTDDGRQPRAGRKRGPCLGSSDAYRPSCRVG